jgi:hypothetical protein
VVVLLFFWLAIQTTANRHVSNALGLPGEFISFPLESAIPGRKAGGHSLS